MDCFCFDGKKRKERNPQRTIENKHKHKHFVGGGGAAGERRKNNAAVCLSFLLALARALGPNFLLLGDDDDNR